MLPSATVSMVKDIGPWTDNAIAMITSKAMFFGIDSFEPGALDALWITNGTAAGTIKLREFSEIAHGFGATSFIEYHDELYFAVTGYDGDPDIGLWKSNGTAVGTVQVAALDGPPSNFAILNDRLFFSGVDDSHGWELWTSDGTGPGTHLVIDLLPGRNDGLDTFGGGGFAVLNDRLFFSGQSRSNDLELWSSDGTAAGTQLVKDIYTASYIRPFDGARVSSSEPSDLTVINGHLVFQAMTHADANDTYQHTMWLSDGTTAGTIEVKNLGAPIPGTTATQLSSPNFLGQYNGLLYFSGHTNDPKSDWELWATDGTVAGIRFIKDLRQGVHEMGISQLAGSNGLVYFNAGDDTHGDYEPFVTDGTKTGTRLLKDVDPTGNKRNGPNSSKPGYFTPFGSKYTVFSASDGKKGAELFLTDGTTAGTQRVTDIVKGKNPSFPVPFTTDGSGMLFFAIDPDRFKLYRLTVTGRKNSPANSDKDANLSALTDRDHGRKHHG